MAFGRPRRIYKLGWTTAPKKGGGMSSTVYRDPELALLTEFCRALAKLGLNVGLVDARPAVVIHCPEPLWITVDPSGKFFEWHQAQRQHPVTDSAGAAALISEYVKAQRSGPGEAS
jgi:hypothetical protein